VQWPGHVLAERVCKVLGVSKSVLKALIYAKLTRAPGKWICCQPARQHRLCLSLWFRQRQGLQPRHGQLFLLNVADFGLRRRPRGAVNMHHKTDSAVDIPSIASWFFGRRASHLSKRVSVECVTNCSSDSNLFHVRASLSDTIASWLEVSTSYLEVFKIPMSYLSLVGRSDCAATSPGCCEYLDQPSILF
jgi:hypothetical protein